MWRSSIVPAEQVPGEICPEPWLYRTLMSVSSKVITCLTLCEGAVSCLLNRFLGKYVQNLDSSNLNVSIFKGNYMSNTMWRSSIIHVPADRFLGKYVQNLDSSNLNVGIFKGNNMSNTMWRSSIIYVPADRFLGKYVQNLDSSNLNVSIFKGNYMSNTMWRSSTCGQVPGEICPEPWL